MSNEPKENDRIPRILRLGAGQREQPEIVKAL